MFKEIQDTVVKEKIDFAFETQRVVSFEFKLKSGKHENWFDVKIHPHQDGLTAFFQLITNRKRTEQALKYKDISFINVLNNLKDGVCMINSNYEIEFINPVLVNEAKSIKKNNK